MNRLWPLQWLIALLVLLNPAAARADTCSATLSDMNFGAVSPLSASDITASASGTITCSWTLLSATPPYLLLLPNVAVCINIGLGSTSTASNPRSMGSGAARLEYNLYRDASYSDAAIVGSPALAATPTPITSTFNAPNLLTGGTFTQPFSVYGKIPAGTSLAAVATSGNGDTAFSASFAGNATISYAFYNLIKPACGSGASASFAFQAKATLVNNCKILAAPLAFGAAGVLNTAVRGSSMLSVQCVNNNAFQIALNGGSVTGNVARRQMRSASGARLDYRLAASLDGALWGDGSAGTAVLSGIGSGSVVSVPIYGMVPAQATPAPGDYRDTVTATVIF